jgi:hypothetical protein
MHTRALIRAVHVMLVAAVMIGCRERPAPARAPETEAAPAACVVVSPPPLPASAPAPAAPDASARPEEPFATDPENRQKPAIESDDMTERAGHLLEAIATGHAQIGDDFFFPRAPFIPLKDVGDPGRYFDQLLATYHRDIRDLHASRREWGSAKLVSFTIGTTPTWVAPGREYNKIGYWRTFRGQLRWRSETAAGTIDAVTIISYHGRWYVTHLAPIRH